MYRYRTRYLTKQYSTVPGTVCPQCTGTGTVLYGYNYSTVPIPVPGMDSYEHRYPVCSYRTVQYRTGTGTPVLYGFIRYRYRYEPQSEEYCMNPYRTGTGTYAHTGKVQYRYSSSTVLYSTGTVQQLVKYCLATGTGKQNKFQTTVQFINRK